MIQEIADAFNAADATLAVQVSYGRGLDAAEIEGRLRERGTEKLNMILDVQQLLNGEVADATRGIVKEGQAMMYSFAKTDKAALDNLKTWWLTIAGDSGNILHDISGKVTLGTVEFLRWRAVGGFQGFSTKHGGVWMCDQLVEYTAWIPP